MYREYPKSGESRFAKLCELLKLANLPTHSRIMREIVCEKCFVRFFQSDEEKERTTEFIQNFCIYIPHIRMVAQV